MDILKQGVSYDFRVIGVNDYGYGAPSLPSPSISGELFMYLLIQKKTKKRFTFIFRPRVISDISETRPDFFSTALNTYFLCFHPAQKVAPFYEEWWFLVVVALVGLIFILLLVFILIIRGQSKKYAKKSESGGRRQFHN